MYDEHLQQAPPEYGSQASILSAVVSSGGSSSSTGESSSEATTSEGCYHTTRRSLLQALQLSQVLLSAIDKPNQSLDDPAMMQGNGPLLLVEATKTRLLGLKELSLKSRALEQSALDALDGMGAPVTHEAVGAGSHPAGSVGWMSMTEVGLLTKGPVSAQQAETERALQLVNAKLRIKAEGLQRQVELLSSSFAAGSTETPGAAAQGEGSSPSPVKKALEPNEVHGDSAWMVSKLQRELEEKEELLVGLRRTVRDVANDRYPILEERNDLYVKMQTLLQSQARLLEDREALETHNARVESQLRCTADRCQELEAYVRSLEATAVAGQEGGREVGGLLPPLSPSRPPMVHRPDVDAVSPLDVQPAAGRSEVKESEGVAIHSIAVTDAEGGRPSAAVAAAYSPRQDASRPRTSINTGATPSFFLWLLSFFLEPHLEDDDDEDGLPAMIV